MKKLGILIIAAAFAANSSAYAAPAANTADNTPADYDYMAKDSEYIKCRQNAVTLSDDEAAICIAAEVKRQEKLIENVYNQFLSKKQFQNWNNGSGMFGGNMKDMSQQWIGWRNRYCSLYTVAMKEYSPSKAFNYQTCLMEQTWSYYQRLLNLFRNYNADLD